MPTQKNAQTDIPLTRELLNILGNGDTLEIVQFTQGKLVRDIRNFAEPQGYGPGALLLISIILLSFVASYEEQRKGESLDRLLALAKSMCEGMISTGLLASTGQK